MKRFSWMFFALVSVIFLASCSSQKNVIAEFGDHQITYDELEDAYYKNLSEEERKSDNHEEGIKDFLDLYVNYKMKLRDAEVRGFAEDPELEKEINDYTKTVGIPYVEEKFIIEPGVKELYERRKIEKRVSHILLRTENKNVDSVRSVAENIIKRIQNGESFGKLAVEYSEDEFSKPDSGDIYWLTAGQTVPEFDDAVYKTNKGEVYPNPVETKYGFHIVKVTDEEPRIYEIKAQHVLASFNQNNKADTAAAWEKIQLVKRKLAEGVPFEEVAKEYSDDPGSKKNGGDLGYFKRRMMVKPFDEVAFSLKPGEVSDIVETRFGYHIIKVNDRKELPPFDEMKDEFKQLYKRTLYAGEKQNYLDQLKKEYNFYSNDSLISKIKTDGEPGVTFDSSYASSRLKKEYGDSIVYKIKGNDYTFTDIINTLAQNPNYVGAKMTNFNLVKVFIDFPEQKLLTLKALELRNGDTEFAKLMDDYKNGLYIFKLQEEEIWNKIEIDTTQLVKLFEETKDNYVMPDRAAFDVIYRTDSSGIYQDKAALESGTPFETIIETNKKNVRLNSLNGPRSLRNVDGDKVAEMAFSLQNIGDISEPFQAEKGWFIVKLNEKIPARQKTFEEAQSEVIGVWQEQQTKKLEEEYIKRLRKIYEPELYYDRLAELQKK